MQHNGDKDRVWTIGSDTVMGIGSFTKSLPHPGPYGEVDTEAFKAFVAATRNLSGDELEKVAMGATKVAKLTNPRAGLADDRLIHNPDNYDFPPAPTVDSDTTAAEMCELYWMACLRDKDLNSGDQLFQDAAAEIDQRFAAVSGDTPDLLRPGIDVPGAPGNRTQITPQNVFRIGLPGEELGPMISQFFVRPIAFGTQTIDQRQRPYRTGRDFLHSFQEWLTAQRTGFDGSDHGYPNSNEFPQPGIAVEDLFDPPRYIGSMRDLARFVNKDALHQAYFNATLVLLSGGAKWVQGNPYGDNERLSAREAGFGVLGGPHILALVSEVATRALKAVWHQKWQVHLRLRPEVYGGRVHVQETMARAYGLPSWVAKTGGASWAHGKYGTYLLPLAFTAGSPTHPAYGAGHATVAGACVTVLKAYFKTLDDNGAPILFNTLKERPEIDGMLQPHEPSGDIRLFTTRRVDGDNRSEIPKSDPVHGQLTIEGELNKLAQNVAMGRSMGGVHWRTDNTRSLILGETLAIEILADITTDAKERPEFRFRSFARAADGEPRIVHIKNGMASFDDGTSFKAV